MAKSSFSGELIHFNAIRLRVTGVGNLVQRLVSLNDVASESLTSLPMSVATDRELISLADFTKQMAYYEFKTVEMDEQIIISKITMYIKPIAAGYPL